jgi:peptidoglycan/xylan/chitin deacetylase (PgdA/CDA1 family)
MRRTLSLRARRAIGVPLITRAAAAIAAARRRDLVLLFHRVSEDPAASTVVVPTVSRDVLRDQITQLLRIGTVVSLESLLDDRPSGMTPRFGLTFDDDAISHHEVALPILRTLGVTATFFLSGRDLHGTAPPWFEVLDALIRERGASATASLLGVPTTDAQEIASACERDRRIQRLIEKQDAPVPRGLGRGEISELSDAGMSIGFHTLHHHVLTGLPQDDVDAALREGRTELEAVAGTRIRMFAYPHGKADRRVAEQVRLAGYDAAWTGRPRPVTTSQNRWLLGRWEPGRSVGRDFAARLAARTNGVGGR